MIQDRDLFYWRLDDASRHGVVLAVDELEAKAIIATVLDVGSETVEVSWLGRLSDGLFEFDEMGAW